MLYPQENRSFSLDQENLIETIASHLASALEREALETSSRRAEVFEKSEKLHQALLNSVSHELRTPLTAIIGGTTALQGPRTIQDQSLRDRIVGDVIESTQRLQHTIDNLLDMSRVSSGALRLNEQVFELNDFIRSALQRNPHLGGTHPLHLELSDHDLFVQGDEKLLEHVLTNLIGNAVRYSPSGSPITIRSRRNLSDSEFTVLDEGPGIPPENLTRIFERFFRAENATPGGVGLGLSIAKAITEAHQGGIFAVNRPDRTGSAFTVRLPFREVPKEVLQ